VFIQKNKTGLNDLREIKIVSSGHTKPGSHRAEDEVNKLLKDGWQLLETFTTCYSNLPPLTSQQEVHFVLGKKETLEKESVSHALQA